VSKLGGPVSSLLSDVPEMHSTAEERFESRDDQKFEVVKKAVEKFAQFPCELIDGVRVRLPHGWILVRASNTQPVLVSRVEADTQARLGEYKRLLAKTLAEIEAELR
jgi:phosphomannomutase/phosphoglucomutase